MNHVPWYRQIWPWLLMTMPAVALVGGVLTFWLAYSSNNALVVDDYYREGKAINRQLARDRAAAQMGLSASVATSPDGGVSLRIDANPGFTAPDEVVLRVVHATLAERDQSIVFRRVGELYLAPAETRLPGAGRWTLLIEDTQGQWRLSGEATAFDRPVTLTAARH